MIHIVTIWKDVLVHHAASIQLISELHFSLLFLQAIRLNNLLFYISKIKSDSFVIWDFFLHTTE